MRDRLDDELENRFHFAGLEYEFAMFLEIEKLDFASEGGKWNGVLVLRSELDSGFEREGHAIGLWVSTSHG